MTVGIDNEFPQFTNFRDNNGTLIDSGLATFNVTVTSTNGSVQLEFDGVNYTASNLTATEFNVSINLGSSGTFNYQWNGFGNGTDNNFNTSAIFQYTVNETVDNIFPQITNVQDNNGTILDSGTVIINATITSTNGSSGVEFDGTNYTMSNVSSFFNVSFTIMGSGDFNYFVWSYGNGTDNNFNRTQTFDYTINESGARESWINKNNGDPLFKIFYLKLVSYVNLIVKGDLDVEGNYTHQGQVGFTGSCVNTSYSGGIVIGCND